MRLLALLLLAACARRPVPVEPTANALYRDLEREVTVAAATGWGVDRLEVDKLIESALDSTCRVDPLTRAQLRAWIDDSIAKRGGPVEEAWRRSGKRLAAVGELLVLTRVRLVLQRAEELALDCPFWIEPEQPFRGRQISDRRWQLSFGGGGKGIATQQGNRLDISAGGSGRLLFGRVFAGGDAVYIGVDAGANASFPKDESGERTSLVLGADAVVPIVYRRTLTNAYFELEAGWLGRATETDWNAIDHGVHVGAAFGARALRTRFLFPGAALGISWERSFVPGDDLMTLKVGARAAFDLDL